MEFPILHHKHLLTQPSLLHSVLWGRSPGAPRKQVHGDEKVLGTSKYLHIPPVTWSSPHLKFVLLIMPSSFHNRLRQLTNTHTSHVIWKFKYMKGGEFKCYKHKGYHFCLHAFKLDPFLTRSPANRTVIRRGKRKGRIPTTSCISESGGKTVGTYICPQCLLFVSGQEAESWSPKIARF